MVSFACFTLTGHYAVLNCFMVISASFLRCLINVKLLWAVNWPRGSFPPVSPFMTRQVPLCSKTLSRALGAFQGFLWVSFLFMICQSPLHFKGSRAGGALKAIFVCVNFLMNSQVTFCSKAVMADGTFKGPFTRVDPFMICQATQLSKPFRAGGACEGPFGRVCLFVI